MSNRTKRVRVTKLLAGLVAFSLIAAACGGGSSSGSTSAEASSTTTTTAAAETATTAAPAADATSGATAEKGDSVAESTVTDLLRTTEGAKSGGTLRLGVISEADGLNPTVNRFSPTGYQMGYTILEPLFYWDATGAAIPYLAESGISSDDGMTFTIKLRPNITFTDGEPLNADALLVNLRAILDDPVISIALSQNLNLDDPAEKIDDLTLQLNLSAPNLLLATGLTAQLAMPGSPKWLAAAKEDDSLNQMPVGTGPFMMDSRTQDSVTRVVKNPDWWQTRDNGTEVYLDAIEFYPITDSEIIASQLIGGELDGMQTTTADAIATIRDEGDNFIRMEEDQGAESFAIINSQNPPFDDIRVRQALTFATPLNNYVDFAGAGILRGADTMFAPELVWNNADVKQEGDMPDKAGPLIASYCGDFPDNCTDGRVDMDFTQSGPSVSQEQIADILTEGWGEFFNVNRVLVLEDDLITNVVLGAYQVSTWRQFSNPDPAADRLWLVCESIGFVSLNFPRLCDPARDDLLNAARETTDLATRVDLWKQVQQKMHDDYVYIFFTRTLWMMAFDSSVRNQCGAQSPDGVELLCQTGGAMFNYSMWFDK